MSSPLAILNMNKKDERNNNDKRIKTTEDPLEI